MMNSQPAEYLRFIPAAAPERLPGEGYVDPMSQTLCGAPAGHFDEWWAATRCPKNRAQITCQRCIELRLADQKAIG